MFGSRYKYIFDGADIDDMWYTFLQDNPHLESKLCKDDPH